MKRFLGVLVAIAIAFSVAASWSLALGDATVPPATSDGGQPAAPRPPANAIACETVADCWLDDAGAAIKRPKRFRGKPLPRGDCGGRILWLRNRLTCEDHQCVARHIGDKC